MTFSKTPWYGTIAFIGLLTALCFLLPAGSAVSWGITGVKRYFQQRKDAYLNSSQADSAPRLASFARVAAAAFSLVTLVFLLGLVAIFTDIDPSYGAPRVFYGLTPLAGFVLSLP